MTEVPTFSTTEVAPATAAKGRWTRTELERTLGDSSAHVRFLLKELADGGELAATALKSRPVAFAHVQRICNSRGKEALVIPSLRGSTKFYALQPSYRRDVGEIVADASQPPPTEPKPAGERGPPRPRLGRRNQMSALDGIADVRGSALTPPPPLPVRRISQGQVGRTLAIPADIAIDFCKELLGFVNATANGTRYRIVLEDVGYRLEAC